MVEEQVEKVIPPAPIVSPIWVKLSPGEAYIIERDADGWFLVAENHEGKVVLKWIAEEE